VIAGDLQFTSLNDIYPLFLSEAALNLVQVIIQTLLYFYVKGLCMVISEVPQEQRQQSSRTRYSLFKAVLISLIITNLTLWAVNSFNNTDKTSKKPQSDEWSIIFEILKPLSLMYRFNCFIIFNESLRKLM